MWWQHPVCCNQKKMSETQIGVENHWRITIGFCVETNQSALMKFLQWTIICLQNIIQIVLDDQNCLPPALYNNANTTHTVIFHGT